MNIALRHVLLAAAGVLAFAPAASSAQMTPHPSAPPIAPFRLTVGTATFAGLPRRSVAVTEEDGTHAVYEGVDLDAVLTAAGAPSGTAIGGAALASYVLVRAADGYRVTFTLPELDAAFGGRRVLLCDRRNGQPLPPRLGAYRLVVPDDRRRARWIRQVTAVEFVVLPATDAAGT